MKFPRFRFSLRTLLLLTLFAGSAMLCWSVREAWAFKKFPPFRKIDSDHLLKFDRSSNFAFSPSNEYIVVTSCQTPWDVPACRLFNLKTGEQIFDSDKWTNVKVHPSRDWILRRTQCYDDDGAGEVQIVEISSGEVLFKTFGHMNSYPYFSKNGELLVIHFPGKCLQFFETTNWKKISEISLAPDEDSFCLIDDSHAAVIFSTGGSTPFGGAKSLALKAVRCANGELLWKWKTAENINKLMNLRPNEKERRIVCNYTNQANRDECYSIGYDGTNAYKMLDCTAHDSTDLAWGETKSKDGRLILLMSFSRNAVLLRDKSWENVSEISFPDYWSINWIGISDNAQFASGIVDGNAIGRWTFRRHHFEWWGIYEQPESWLAVAMFGLLIWSIRRDWKALR